MLRVVISVACRSSGSCNHLLPARGPATTILANINNQIKIPAFRNFTSLTGVHPIVRESFITANPQFLQFAKNQNVQIQPTVRTLTKFSLRTGKRKAVKCVLHRFKRLHWGGWIRTHCGRAKKLHKKTVERRRILKQHVLLNSTQSWLLDKMVGRNWRKPRYYIDDPYLPYHERTHPMARTKAIEYWPSRKEYSEDFQRLAIEEEYRRIKK